MAWWAAAYISKACKHQTAVILTMTRDRGRATGRLRAPIDPGYSRSHLHAPYSPTAKHNTAARCIIPSISNMLKNQVPWFLTVWVKTWERSPSSPMWRDKASISSQARRQGLTMICYPKVSHSHRDLTRQPTGHYLAENLSGLDFRRSTWFYKEVLSINNFILHSLIAPSNTYLLNWTYESSVGTKMKGS